MRLDNMLFFPRIISVALMWIVLGVHPVSATIYKWKDDQGKTHFTDNPENIPLKYRKPEDTKTIRGLPPLPGADNETDKGGEGGKTSEDSVKTSPEEGVKETEQTMAIVKVAIAFFEVESSRYKGFYDKPPNRQNYRDLKAVMANVIKQKEDLLKKISDSQDSALQEATSFIEETLPQDQEFFGNMGSYRPVVRRTFARLKQESSTCKQILANLKLRLSELEQLKKDLETAIKDKNTKKKPPESEDDEQLSDSESQGKEDPSQSDATGKSD